MPLFDDARFPTAISRRATGGPERRTEVVTTASGREERNSRWAHSRRKYNIGFGVKSVTDLQAVIAFFEARRGKLYAFRYKDFTDFKSCAPTANVSATDQVIGTGTGVASTFQLVKHYGAPLRDYQRSIFAPVAGTVLVAVNGTPSVNFTTDVSTGLITFNAGSIPANGAVVTAGFEFDVPVRFDTDQITVNLAHFNAGEIPDIPLVEVRP
jgi:uncharacterized protein (TIGR02217 family)